MIPSYHHSYLVGALIFWIAWIACSVLCRAYRAEIRWGTLLAAPMALTSLLFVPQYWTPPRYLTLMKESESESRIFSGRLRLVVLLVLLLHPQFVQRYYNLSNLLGIGILGVPIEELLFAATGGAIWSVAYEYVFGYRLEAAGRI